MSLFNRNCKEVTRLILAGEDRRLGPLDRVAIAWHMLVCTACPRFLRQAGVMRRALDRWKHYKDGGP